MNNDYHYHDNTITIDDDDDSNKKEMEISRAVEESISSYYTDMQQNYESEDLEIAIERSIKSSNDHDMNSNLETAIKRSIESRENYEMNVKMNDLATSYTVSRSKERKNGCWDCPRCTYVQTEPYKSKCMACGANAPCHVLYFSSIPSDLRFGLEIEIIIPNGVIDGFKFSTLAQNLTNIGPEKVEYLGYTHATSPHWKIVPDSSIRGDNDSNHDLCFELVSTVLQSESGLV